jgi:hypothetical protein
MAEHIEVKEIEQVVIRFSGDSGDGMQLYLYSDHMLYQFVFIFIF